MEKELVPYIESKDLKELGFDMPCIAVYEPQEIGVMLRWVENQRVVSNKAIGYIIAPLYQQAFRFFREKYGYDVSIKKRRFEIQKLEVYGEDNPDYYFTDFPFDSYEESEFKCLLKLIEIVKRKK